MPTEPGAGPAATPAPRVITPAALRAWPLPQPGGGGKEGRGRVLVVGGSRSTPGAVLLAAEAALRAGAGKLSVATPSDIAVPLAVALPEAGVEGLPTDPDGSFAAAAAEAVSERVGGMRGVLIGPGMSDPEATRAIVEAALGVLADDAVVVLDAMAVTCGAVTPEALRPLGQRVVLTPNPAEMAMLLGCDDSDDRDPVALARDASERFGAVVAFSGVVAGPNGRHVGRRDGCRRPWHVGLGRRAVGRRRRAGRSRCLRRAGRRLRRAPARPGGGPPGGARGTSRLPRPRAR